MVEKWLKTRPLFIVLEGIDGSGTTTQGEKLAEWLRQNGVDVHFTHEPSTGPAGMLIRLALSNRLLGLNFDYHDPMEDAGEKGIALDSKALALLYAADRLDHLATEVRPNLRRGRFVVCDRYTLSSLAYQGMTADEAWLVDINREAQKPDVTIYLDVPVEEARRRMRKTRWTRDLFEGEADLRKIRDCYLGCLKRWGNEIGPFKVLDGTKPVSSVHRQIVAIVEDYLRTGRVSGIDQPETSVPTLL